MRDCKYGIHVVKGSMMTVAEKGGSVMIWYVIHHTRVTGKTDLNVLHGNVKQRTYRRTLYIILSIEELDQIGRYSYTLIKDWAKQDHTALP